MSNQTVVIIGSNRGIGLALVQEYLQHGWTVHAVCRSNSAELSNMQHPQLHVVEGVDVTNANDRQRLAKILPKQIDEVIHNAGILRRDSLSDINDTDIFEQLQVNTLAPLHTLLTLRPHLQAGSKVGIITSRMGSIGDCGGHGMLGYRISKAGVNMVGKNLANAWRDAGITVLLLHPGFVKTDMTGGNGFINTTESASGLYQQLRLHGLEQTGSFWHTNGEALEW